MKNQGMFHGIIVVVPTPLTERQDVDAAGLAHLVNYYVEAGCHGVLLLGSGGEYPYFSIAEKKEIVRVGAGAARGRVPVIVGSGYCGFSELQTFIREIASIKIDGLLISLPTYYPVKADDVTAYYARLRSITGIPVLYYHFPQVTGLSLSARELSAVLSLPGIAGIKDSELKIPVMRALMSMVSPEKPFSYFTGVGLLLTDTISLGGAGIIDPLASVAPVLVVACYEALVKGDLERARGLQAGIDSLLPVMNTFSMSGSLQKAGFFLLSRLPFSTKSGTAPRHAVLKETLRQLGHPINATVKSPLPQVTDEERSAVSVFIRDNGLKK